MMDEEFIGEVVMPLIISAGNAKSLVMEAIYQAKAGDIAGAKDKIAEAEEALNDAHRVQTQLLQKEASGNSTALSLLLVHAQDHLMTAILAKDLATEIIDLHHLKANK